MTPKEKAKELVDKLFYAKDEQGFHSYNGYRAKQCALIAVDEMTKYIPNIYHNDIYKEKYWKQVKKEIRKL
jgi:hypothetical protein